MKKMILPAIRRVGFIRLILAPLLCAILVVALYDLFHPNNSPSLATAAGVVFAGIAAFLVLRIENISCPRSLKQAALILFTVGFVVRAAVIVLIPTRQVSDFRIFHELAAAIVDGRGFAYDGPIGLSEDVGLFRHISGATGPMPTAFRLPGTPLIMAAVYAVFGRHEIGAKLLNAVMGAGIGMCLLMLLWRGNPRRAFWAGFIGEAYPSTLFNTNLLGTEIHFTFWMVFAALAFARAMGEGKSHSFFYAFAAGLAVGCTCLIRASTHLILCTIAAALWIVWQRFAAADHSALMKAVRLTAILLLGIAIPLTAWGARNYRVFGVFEWQATEIGLNFLTMTQNIVPPEKQRSLDSLMAAFFRSQNEFEIARIGKEIGLRRLTMAAVEPDIIIKVIKNFMKTWKHDRDGLCWCLGFLKGDESRHHAGEPVESPAYRLLRLLVDSGYITLLVLALFGTVVKRNPAAGNPGVMIMLLYFLGSCVLFCLFQGQPRYHFPMVPLLCIFAANSIGALVCDRSEYH